MIKAFPSATILISSSFKGFPKLMEELDRWQLSRDHLVWLPPVCNISIGETSLHVVCPSIGTAENDNDGSMFVRVNEAGATAVFSGDAPSFVEDHMLIYGKWTSDLLHVGHHGSRTSTGMGWLRAVRPTVAVISCGLDNPYGHPNRETLQRLSDNGIPVERTDRQGDLEFIPRDGHYVPKG